jgi:hypothetical protein
MAGDDQVELDIEGVEDVGELQAILFAVAVEGTAEVKQRVGPADAGAGVTEEIEVHSSLALRRSISSIILKEL